MATLNEVRPLARIDVYTRQWRDGKIDGQEVVTDTLTELIKFARLHAVDFEHALELARDHADEEGTS